MSQKLFIVLLGTVHSVLWLAWRCRTMRRISSALKTFSPRSISLELKYFGFDPAETYKVQAHGYGGEVELDKVWKIIPYCCARWRCGSDLLVAET